MDEATAANIIRWYQSLEEVVVEFLKYIPPQSQNMTIWSPKLSTVIVEACAIIDTLLRYISPPVHARAIGGKKRRDELDISHYAELYSFRFQLPSRKIILLVSPPSYRSPFADWSKQVKGSSRPPKWWTVNNQLKHQRIENFIKATLDAAIDSLSASLLIISKIMIEVPELMRVVLRHGLLDLGGWNPEHLLEVLQKGQEGRMLETSLFALWLGNWELPEDINDFSPARHHGSKRLLAFFGKF